MKILHPFSNTQFPEETIISSEGYYIHTSDKKYLDFISGIYNVPLGYSVNSIKSKINDAFIELPSNHIFSSTCEKSQTHKYLVELEHKLSSIIPFSKYLFLTNSGSEAIDSSINLCRMHDNNNRDIVLSYTGSYHGSTYATLSISGNLTKKKDYLIDFYYFYDERTPDEYMSYVEEKILKIGPENILAFVAEPMIGASGGFFMKENILPQLKKLLQKYNIYLILDEVISGFGRLGSLFAYRKYNIVPDVLVLSKAITNGYMPMACCITSFELSQSESISFGFSTSAHPVACAAAIESIRLIESLMNNVEDLEKYILNKFIEFGIKEQCYKIDSSGLFFSLHFSKFNDTYLQYSNEENIGGNIAKKMRERGYVVRGNPKSLILAPGYSMSYEVIDSLLKDMYKVINEYT